MRWETVVLTFIAGIAISAFTNILTGLDAEHLSGWRIGSMIAFLLSSIMFFISVFLSEKAVQKAKLRTRAFQRGKTEFLQFFHGLRGPQITIAGLIIFAIALVLLIIGSFIIGSDPL